MNIDVEIYFVEICLVSVAHLLLNVLAFLAWRLKFNTNTKMNIVHFLPRINILMSNDEKNIFWNKQVVARKETRQTKDNTNA